MEKEHHEMLVEGASLFGISLDIKQVELFSKVLESMIEGNKQINLTALTDEKEIVIKHFLDSLTPLPCIKSFGNIKLIDVGTGAGFPGVPLKIARPDIEIVLLDSLKKRVAYLSHLIKETGLRGISVVHGRAEDFGHNKQFREKFDVAVSRAVAKLSALTELCLPFVKTGGMMIALKGPGLQEENEEAGKAIIELGGEFVELVEIKLPVTEDKRILALIKKATNSPAKYPRRAGIPERKPIG
jgi:16S rRNA (guanine527-N7)-methyltransferase